MESKTDIRNTRLHKTNILTHVWYSFNDFPLPLAPALLSFFTLLDRVNAVVLDPVSVFVVRAVDLFLFYLKELHYILNRMSYFYALQSLLVSEAT